ncbi:class I SAM-dependent methyltransferase, partial [Thermodesulfobacteriota bacterium]
VTQGRSETHFTPRILPRPGFNVPQARAVKKGIGAFGRQVITVDLSKLDIQSGHRVLDIGCGPGRHVFETFRQHNVDAVGLDLVHENLRKARFVLTLMEWENASAGGSWNLVNADAVRIPFPGETFNAVICSEVLEHIEDDASAVREIVRVLKPGGAVVVSVPGFLTERLCWSLHSEYRAMADGHMRIYRRVELVRLLTSFGLEFESFEQAHALHSPYWWLRCVAASRSSAGRLVSWYRKFLEWHIATHSSAVSAVEGLLNPLIGKSIVLYLKKRNCG